MWSSWFIRSCLLIMFLATGLFAIRPMVTYRALELGATTAEVGFLAASYAMLSFLIAVPAGRWADRFGEGFFLVTGSALMAGMSLVLYFAQSLFVLALSQAVLGAAHIVALVAVQRMVASGGPPAQREGRFGFFAVFASIGQVLGPTLAGFVAASARGSTRVTFSTSALVLVLAALVAASLRFWPPDRKITQVAAEEQQGILRSIVSVLRMRSMPQAMAASIMALVAVDLLVAYLPAYGEHHGIPVATVGILLSIRAAVSGLTRIGMVRIIDTFGRKEVFIGSLVLPAFALFLVPLFPNPLILGFLMVLIGLGLGFGQPMSISFVSSVAPPEVRGTALGVRLSGNRAGQVVLPVAVGFIGGASGVGAVFVALGMIMTATAAWLTSADFEGAAGGH